MKSLRKLFCIICVSSLLFILNFYCFIGYVTDLEISRFAIGYFFPISLKVRTGHFHLFLKALTVLLSFFIYFFFYFKKCLFCSSLPKFLSFFIEHELIFVLCLSVQNGPLWVCMKIQFTFVVCVSVQIGPLYNDPVPAHLYNVCICAK